MVVGLLAACATTASRSREACGAPIDRQIEVDDAVAQQMVGSFELSLVVTSFSPEEGGVDDDGVHVSRLDLRLPSEAEVDASTINEIGHGARRSLRLVGSWDWSNGRFPSETAELDADTLYLGCRDCLDGSPLHLAIADVSTAGFRGSWRDYQTGIGHVVGAQSGEFLPDPAGHYCAVRL